MFVQRGSGGVGGSGKREKRGIAKNGKASSNGRGKGRGQTKPREGVIIGENNLTKQTRGGGQKKAKKATKTLPKVGKKRIKRGGWKLEKSERGGGGHKGPYSAPLQPPNHERKNRNRGQDKSTLIDHNWPKNGSISSIEHQRGLQRDHKSIVRGRHRSKGNSD